MTAPADRIRDLLDPYFHLSSDEIDVLVGDLVGVVEDTAQDVAGHVWDWATPEWIKDRRLPTMAALNVSALVRPSP